MDLRIVGEVFVLVKVSEEDLAEFMAKYGYIMNFKGRKVKDMRAIGYLKLAEKYGLEAIDPPRLEHYSVDSVDGKTVRAVVGITVYFKGKPFGALADMDDRSVSVRGPDMVVRAADTAALKRAIARALLIDKEELQQFEVGKARAEEEEIYTPTPPESEEVEKEIKRVAEEAEKEEAELEREIEELAEEFEW